MAMVILLSLAIRPLVVYNSTAGDEGNVCAKSQVAAIRVKNWFAYYYPDKIVQRKCTMAARMKPVSSAACRRTAWVLPSITFPASG